MKKSFYFFALLGLLFVLPACQKEVVVDDNGLTSPSGQRLANDKVVLGDMVEKFYFEEYGMDFNTLIQDVRWEKSNGVDVAIVSYTNYFGEVVKFAATYGKNPSTAKVAPVVSCNNVSCGNPPCALAVRQVGDWTIYDCTCIIGGNPGNPGCEVQATGTIN